MNPAKREILAALMREVVANEPERRRLRERSRARAAALYSWDAITDQYEHLFDSMLRPSDVRRASPEARGQSNGR